VPGVLSLIDNSPRGAWFVDLQAHLRESPLMMMTACLQTLARVFRQLLDSRSMFTLPQCCEAFCVALKPPHSEQRFTRGAVTVCLQSLYAPVSCHVANCMMSTTCKLAAAPCMHPCGMPAQLLARRLAARTLPLRPWQSQARMLWCCPLAVHSLSSCCPLAILSMSSRCHMPCSTTRPAGRVVLTVLHPGADAVADQHQEAPTT
jgi:hypothetical protein